MYEPMSIKLITFCDDRMTISARKCVESAIKYGANEYSMWTPDDLSCQFKETMKMELLVDKGYGLYCWKPYIVHREINILADGDVLVWCDAGNEWLADIHHLVNAMDEETKSTRDILFFSNGWKHVEWCKMDVLRAILPKYRDGLHSMADAFVDTAHQVQASTFVIRVTPATRLFIKEWYAWSIMPGMIDNEPSVLPNVPSFREHRWDQSILCCLQIKYGYRLHWFPTTTALHLAKDFPNDKYPTMLYHHRRRNNEW